MPKLGGEKGKAALLRLERIFGRVQSPWLPAPGDETYEIIRRRLFQPLDSDGECAREETIKAFHDLYKKNQAEFPPEMKQGRYLELLRLSYPIHPELFERLSKDWASLEKFQRTRGVLRFVANVVGVLWQAQVRDPLITPGRVPTAHERVRASVLYPLDPAFAAVVDKEVDGEGSLPSRMEATPSRRISQMRAATRAARAVFLCSAPLAGRPNASVAGTGLRLACAEPGDQLSIFGDALRELTERATYLYEEAGRYWFSTQPTQNRLADDRAKALPGHEVAEEIVKTLREEQVSKSGFHRVFAAADDPIKIDEAMAISLVILGPSTPHIGKGVAKSPATDIVADTLMRCRASQRRFRHTLIFVAADEALLSNAQEAIRKAKAWSEISQDKQLRDQLPTGQIRDAEEKAKTSRDGALKAVRNAWSHILFPIKTESTEAGKAFELDHLSVTSKDRGAIPTGVYDKARSDGFIKDKLGPDALWHHLKPLWPNDKPHLAIAEVADWFASYVYLPKLRDRVVFDTAIRDAVAKINPAFGYAENFDPASDTYSGLILAKAAPEIFRPSALLVRSDVAAEYLCRQQPPAQSGTSARSAAGHPLDGVSEAPMPISTAPTGPRKPRRFYGSVEIDVNRRPVKSFEDILSAVVLELQRTPGTKVKLTLEIDANAESGFDETEVSIVRDNAKQLKFNAGSTGFEE
jgi:uncharacterized protein